MTPHAWLQELGPGEVIKTSHPIEKMLCSIGTDSHSNIELRGRGIAEVHAWLRTTAKGIAIEAVGGERLIVNGRKAESHVLAPGDLIDIGPVRLRFHVGPKGRDTERVPGSTEVGGLLTALAGFSEALAGTYDLDALLSTMLDSIIQVTQAARGVVLLVVDGKPQVRIARNLGGSAARGPLAISDSIVERVLRTRQPVIVSDALNDREFNAAKSVMDFRICSVLCVPLMVRGELLGVIYLGNDNVVNLFTEAAREVATVFAAQSAMVLRNALLIKELQLSNQTLTQQIERMNFGSIIGASDSMQELFKKVNKVAGTDLSVLVEGETGTGKELVASELHRRSNRAKGPFVVINCGAIPANLLESELFSGFSDDATRAMHLHKWPGNIRELENRIKKAVIFCDSGTLTAEDLDLGALQTGRIEPLNEAKEIFARGYVRRVLEINGGNRTQTAKDLDVDVRTIYRYLEREGTTPG